MNVGFICHSLSFIILDPSLSLINHHFMNFDTNLHPCSFHLMWLSWVFVYFALWMGLSFQRSLLFFLVFFCSISFTNNSQLKMIEVCTCVCHLFIKTEGFFSTFSSQFLFKFYYNCCFFLSPESIDLLFLLIDFFLLFVIIYYPLLLFLFYLDNLKTQSNWLVKFHQIHKIRKMNWKLKFNSIIR